MPRTTNKQITKFFANSADRSLKWFDESPSENLEDFASSETESVQSMDSDSSGDLWGEWSPEECDFYPTPDWENFNPEAEKKLIENTRGFYKEISARINKNTAELTKKLEAKRFQFQIGELALLESILDFTTPKIVAQLTPLPKDACGAKTPFQLLGERLDKLTNEVDAKIAEAKAEREPIKDPFANYWKFPVKVLGKEPRCKWREPCNQQKAPLNLRRFNTGIPTGPRNNLLVVDFDVKDDGVTEFGKYSPSTASLKP